ncbi:MAG: hypothetical protein HY040_26360 [Planctomycetes bacterium]|nr:hypothetical protein [Planctomycetota bacterium]
MDHTFFDDLKNSASTGGPTAAIDRLCSELKNRKDYNALFYALLMKKRHEIGASPVPTGSNQDIPAELQPAFEDGIREAGRTVGRLFLDDGNIPQAWAYYRMLGETAPVFEALDAAGPGQNDDAQPLIEIAFHQGVHPKKGFDWILERYGICSAITTMGGGELPFPPDVKSHCIKRLVHCLHDELTARLKAEIERQQGFAPTAHTIPELIAGRDWLFADDGYHIDLSHLSSVVQLSSQLDDVTELRLARVLCAYGKKLSGRFLGHSDPPFENFYQDHDAYLSILSGEDIEGGLAHFHKKAEEADPQTIGTYPAEVLVNLYLRLKRPQDALSVAKKFLSHLGDTRVSCPSIVELCQQTGDYQTLAEVAKEQGNAVNYVAGLIAERERSPA